MRGWHLSQSCESMQEGPPVCAEQPQSLPSFGLPSHSLVRQVPTVCEALLISTHARQTLPRGAGCGIEMDSEHGKPCPVALAVGERQTVSRKEDGCRGGRPVTPPSNGDI